MAKVVNYFWIFGGSNIVEKLNYLFWLTCIRNVCEVCGIWAQLGRCRRFNIYINQNCKGYPQPKVLLSSIFVLFITRIFCISSTISYWYLKKIKNKNGKVNSNTVFLMAMDWKRSFCSYAQLSSYLHVGCSSQTLFLWWYNRVIFIIILVDDPIWAFTTNDALTTHCCSRYS